MVSRRAFVEGGLGLAAGLAAWPAHATRARREDTFGSTETVTPAPLRVAVVDRGVAGSAAFAAAARARGLRVFEFTSDVAQVWMRELEPRLRLGALEILGYSSPATSFCLELLARDFGAGAAQPLGVSTWLIATNPARRAPLAPLSQQQG
ncbi:MAG TPA: hypothetical protein VKA43_09685 [Gammaproteobacteria bacterium]|nr:hypothetical protein [Gammaproteobacteria bacterium]